MHTESRLVEVPNKGVPTTEYIEDELLKLGISPLRWAIVKVNDEKFTISVADLKE